MITDLVGMPVTYEGRLGVVRAISGDFEVLVEFEDRFKVVGIVACQPVLGRPLGESGVLAFHSIAKNPMEVRAIWQKMLPTYGPGDSVMFRMRQATTN